MTAVPWKAAVVVCLVLAAAPVGPLVAHADQVPFHDSSAKGSLTFCDEAGRPLTRGSLATRPFAWRAVSSAPAPVGDAHAKATLMAYQPRPESDPGNWSGTALTGSSSFTNPAHPMAAATYGDVSLLSFVQSYPPQWDGLVQLRMRFTNPDAPDATSYPAAVVRISGDVWTLVSGGGAGCTSGRAASTELATLPMLHLDRPRTAAQRAARAATFAAAQQQHSATANPAGTQEVQSPGTATGATGSSSNAGMVAAVAALAATASAAAAVMLVGRRRGRRRMNQQ